MLQLVYISTVKGEDPDLDSVLMASRRNNARDGVTGLLFYDGKRFLQALEGEEATVGRVFARIQADPRHHALVVLSRRAIIGREFGDWSMAHAEPGVGADAMMDRVGRLVSNAAPAVRATFERFAAIRRAA